jgi:translation initiation factor 2 alpha subunit (eIF-2alpha)
METLTASVPEASTIEHRRDKLLAEREQVEFDIQTMATILESPHYRLTPVQRHQYKRQYKQLARELHSINSELSGLAETAD